MSTLASPAFPQGISGVIFDCDGVMIDSTEANREYYNRILAYFGMPPMTGEQENYAFMATSAQALEFLLPERLHASIPTARKVVDYREKIMPLVKIFPGFLDFVGNLHNYGIKMAVLTNRTAEGMQAIMDILAMPLYFDPIVTASSGCCKPQPCGALSILSQWGADASSVLYVGDSEVDRQTAEAAKIPFAVAPGARTKLAGRIQAKSYAGLADSIGLS